MEPSVSDSLVYSLSNLATPVPEKRSRSRYSARSASFLQRTQDSITPSANYSTRTTPGGNITGAASDSLMDFTCAGSLYRPANGSTNFDGDTTAFNATTASASEHPAVAATVGIYLEFMQAYQSYQSEHDIFDLLDKYESLCDKYLAKLRKVTERMVQRAGDLVWSETAACLGLLTEERNAWQLTKVLLRDRMEMTEHQCDEESMLVDTIGKEASDQDIVDSLYARDALVRRAQLVIDWLERSAALDSEFNHGDRMEYFTDGGCAWENTLYRLKARGVDGGGAVGQLDPDAPQRLRQPLHDEDREDEARLFRCVFTHMRRGQLQRAQELAMENGHHWLAATLEGWRPHHDPNLALNSASPLQPTTGIPYRDLWKAACWDMATSPSCTTYERAVYAALCGNLEGVLPACNDWKDHLWARLKVLVDVATEQELRTATQQGRSLEPLPAGFPNERGTLEQVYRDLQATPDIAVHAEVEPSYLVQRHIVLDDFEGMVEGMREWLESTGTSTPMQTMRFMAHVVLLLQRTSEGMCGETCNIVVRSYVKQLVDGGHAALVATYASALPPGDQIVQYTRLLRSLNTDDPDRREQCLTLAKEAGLDVAAITRTLVEQVRTSDTEFAALAESGPLVNVQGSAEVTPRDHEKIASLDWLLIEPSTRGEAIKQANALLRGFVCLGKLAAAREAFDRLPRDSVNVATSNHPFSSTSKRKWGWPSAEEENSVREYLCFQALFQAHESFEEWFDHFHKRKPSAPPSLAAGARFSEKVAHEQRSKSYTMELQRWKDLVSALAKEVEKHVYNVLLFVDGGWMVDQRHDDEDEDTPRRRQMAALRRLCIPQLTFLLHQALEQSDLARDCMTLLDVVASEKNGLYREFGKEELRTLLRRSRSASLALLNSGHDALGYTLE